MFRTLACRKQPKVASCLSSGARPQRTGTILSGPRCFSHTRGRRNESPLVQSHPTHLSIDLPSSPSGSPLNFPYVWLRDSCRCSSCVDPHTSQKSHRSSDIPLDITAPDAHWVDGELVVRWNKPIYRHDTSSVGLEGHTGGSNEVHVSRFPEEFLRRHASHQRLASFHQADQLKPVPWMALDLGSVRHHFSWKDIMKSDETLLEALTVLTKYGAMIVKGAPTTIYPDVSENWEARQMANRISYIRETFYGQLWDVKSYAGARNVAYTDLDLDVHMDLMYMGTPPRYQILHCLRNRNVTGGESILVDALQAAHTLFKDDREAFDLLCNTDVAFWYINDGHHLEQKHKTIELGPSAANDTSTSSPPEITALNYSPPFQAPLPIETPAAFYPALQKFAALLRMPEARYEFLLQEGDIMVFDNRRVLHARRSFTEHPTGKEKPGESNRWLKGCYTEADAVLDRVRVLRTKLERGRDVGS